MRPPILRLALLVLVTALVVGVLLPGDSAAQKKVRWKMPSAFTSSLDVVGESGPVFAENLRKMSGGALDIKFFEPGALVPAFEVFNAVSKGSAEAGFAFAVHRGGIDEVDAAIQRGMHGGGGLGFIDLLVHQTRGDRHGAQRDG